MPRVGSLIGLVNVRRTGGGTLKELSPEELLAEDEEMEATPKK